MAKVILDRLAASGGLLILRLVGLSLALGFVVLVLQVGGVEVLGAYAAIQATAIVIGAVASAAPSRRLAVASASIFLNREVAFAEMARAVRAASMAATVALAVMIIILGRDPWLTILFVSPALSANQVLCRSLNYAHQTNYGFGAERIISPGASIIILASTYTWIDPRLAVGLSILIAPFLSTLYLGAATRHFLPRLDTVQIPIVRDMRETVPFMISVFLDLALPATVLLICRAIIGAEGAGSFAFALTLSGSLSVIHLAITMPFVGRISEAWRAGDIEKSRALLRQSQLRAGFTATMFAALLLVFCALFATFLFPDRAVSYSLLVVISFGHLFRAFSGGAYFVIEGMGNRWWCAAAQCGAMIGMMPAVAFSILAPDHRLLTLAGGFALAMGVRTLALQLFADRLWRHHA